MKKFNFAVVLVLFTALKTLDALAICVDGQNGDLFISDDAKKHFVSKPIAGMNCYPRSKPNDYVCVDKSVAVKNGDFEIILPARKVTKAKKM